MSEKDKTMDVINPLADAFNYTPDDLRANRAGKLSGRQSRRMWGRFIIALVQLLLLMTVPVGVTWWTVSWGADLSFEEVIYDNRAMIGYLVAAILSGFYLISNSSSLALIGDLLGRRVRPLRGEAAIWGRYLKMGKRRFVLDDDALAAIQPNLVYRAYILPASGVLLSIEYAE